MRLFSRYSLALSFAKKLYGLSIETSVSPIYHPAKIYPSFAVALNSFDEPNFIVTTSSLVTEPRSAFSEID